MKEKRQGIFKGQIPLSRPWMGQEEVSAAGEAIRSGWVSQGPRVEEFENKVARFLGAKYAVASNSCTSSLFMFLKASGVGPGDEVILPDLTCMANANAVLMTGARPVFVDIDEKTLNIDPKKTGKAITRRTKAVTIVSQIGLPADLDKFIKIKNRSGNRKIKIINDAATSLGSKYKGKYLGGDGITTVFSFHPRKMITTGEGGMMVTDDFRLAEKTRILRATGASVSDLKRHKAKGTILQKYYVAGYNFRMTDIQAAIGIVQMDKLKDMIEIRKEQAGFYMRKLKDVRQIEMPYIPEYASHVFSSFLIKIKRGSGITAKQVIEKMAHKGIACRFGIQPLHKEPVFRNLRFRKNGFLSANSVARNSFFVPIFPGLAKKEQDYVVSSLKMIFNGSKGLH